MISKGIKFLLNTQKKDGSWDGPLSSRIRETLLVYIVSRNENWKELTLQAKRWLIKNKKDLGEDPLEILLNKELINIFSGKSLDLHNSKFYSETIIRKTLLIYCLAKVCNINVEVPRALRSTEVIISQINYLLKKHEGHIKGWALAEILCCKMILEKLTNSDYKSTFTELMRTKDRKTNWYGNPATTAFILIGCHFCNVKYNSNVYKQFFLETQQDDGGWSYCSIPLWDTGLSLETLNSYKDSIYYKEISKYKSAKDKALSYIKRNQNNDGGWGFNIGLESEADTSSIILYAIRNIQSRHKNSAERYFKDLQFKEGKFKGLWPVWRKTEKPSPEVVGHIVSSLKVINSHIEIKTAQRWLAKLIREGSWKADWGRNLPYFIISVFFAAGINEDTKKLIRVITQCQNRDGGWGAFKGEKSNASATANAIYALKHCSITVQDKDLQKIYNRGVNYLIKKQLPNGTWPRVKEVVGPRPFVYADDNSTHNFVMMSLLK